MSKKIKPLILGLNTPYEVETYNLKRIECFGEEITFKCPECDYEYDFNLGHGENLEYGGFYGMDCCNECGVDFEEYAFEVSITATIKIKEEK